MFCHRRAIYLGKLTGRNIPNYLSSIFPKCLKRLKKFRSIWNYLNILSVFFLILFHCMKQFWSFKFFTEKNSQRFFDTRNSDELFSFKPFIYQLSVSPLSGLKPNTILDVSFSHMSNLQILRLEEHSALVMVYSSHHFN